MMKNNQGIQDLLRKYVNGECDEKEIEKVITFFSRQENSHKIPSVEDVFSYMTEVSSMKEKAADTIFETIIEKGRLADTNIDNPKRLSSRKKAFKYASVAAVFIGLLSLTYFFTQNDSISSIAPLVPEDAITLELEDGSVKILNQDATEKVLDKKGNLLVQQQGNQLLYDKVAEKKELKYNTLTVPYGKRFDVVLSDGTKVKLNAGTSLKYPVSFIEGLDRQVFLKGEAYFDVTTDKHHPFVVNANEINVEVLGTEFNMSFFPEDSNINTVLIEGSVKLYESKDQNNPNSSTILSPGHKAAWNKVEKQMTVEVVDTEIYTAWKDGILLFKSDSFENISKKLERYFDVSIVNNYTFLDGEIYTASFDSNETIEDILEYFKTDTPFAYEIKNNQITIKPTN